MEAQHTDSLPGSAVYVGRTDLMFQDSQSVPFLLAVQITLKSNWHVSGWFWLDVVWDILLLLSFLVHMLLNFYLLRKYKGGKSKFCVISFCLCAWIWSEPDKLWAVSNVSKHKADI